MNDQRKVILAVILSAIILFGFEFLYPSQQPKPQDSTVATTQSDTPAPTTASPAPTPAPTGGATPVIPGTESAKQVAEATREQALAVSKRIKIETPDLHGSISTAGARIDDLKLANYREELDKSSPEIVLLSPIGTPHAYFAEFGWVGTEKGIKLPTSDTVWTADKDVLKPGAPVTLRWDNGEGLVFKRVYAIDEGYMFTVKQSVENKSDKAVTLHPYGFVSRHFKPTTQSFYILHEGPLGVFDGTLTEVDYSDLEEDGPVAKKAQGSWIGITDKYWLTALIPNAQEQTDSRFLHNKTPNKGDKYQVDFLGAGRAIAAGASTTYESHLFAGAKEVSLLDKYGEDLGIANFDLAIDFGWFYFLTKPIFYFLIYLHGILGNLGTSILVLTVIMKLFMFPLANKSYKAMSRMKKLQPKVEKIREQFGDDKMRLNQEMMALYKREKVSPASGCLPMLVQIPVFFALYKVLFVTIEMRHAPFFGWIQDLSAPDPTSVFNLFGMIPWSPPDMLVIGVWPLIMGLSMFLQQKLNPAPPDPLQAKIMMFLPVMFTFMLARFPAGLVIYWAWNNVLSIAQQWYIMRQVNAEK